MPINNKKDKNKKDIVRTLTLVALMFFIIAFVTFFVYKTFFSDDKADNGAQSQTKVNNVDYSPPTSEEKKSGDQVKQSVIQQQNKDTQSNTSAHSNTEVIITDAGQYNDVIEVRAFMPNVYLDGTCTITFTNSSLVVTKQTPAYRDATTTICTNPEFTRSEFQTPGQWTLSVKYEALGSSGVSENKVITIN